jgi:uncharacterized repeat protein (TIGR04138 family)
MQPTAFEDILAQIVREDPRYPAEAYLFLRVGLNYAVKLYHKPDHGPGRHVSGQELIEGLRQYALKEFGPMAFTVLKTWGIRRTDDFGELVFNLVNRGLLGKTDEDRKEDFAAGYDFREAFVKPFLPAPEPFQPQRAAPCHPPRPQDKP